MNRRRILALTGSAVGTGIGVAGVVRWSRDYDHPSRPSSPTQAVDPGFGDENSPDTTDEYTYEPADPRDGAILSGLSFRDIGQTYFDAVTSWLDLTPAIAVIFVNMDRSTVGMRDTIARLETIWERGQVPHVLLQPNFGEESEGAQSVTHDIVIGEHGDVLRAWAAEFERWAIREGEPDRRLYLNLAPEFNGDWVPWGIPTPETTPETYVGMWRTVVDIVTNTDLTSDHVQFVWNPNNVSSEPVDIEGCYPGDAYVDWVGITGYNWEKWGGWTTPADIFDPMVSRVNDITDRPLAFAEFGASADCAGGWCPEKKDEWIHSAYEYMVKRDVRMACWFDHGDPDVTEWGVFDARDATGEYTHEGQTYEVHKAFRNALQRDDVLPVHPSSSRHLADAEFDGSFAE